LNYLSGSQAAADLGAHRERVLAYRARYGAR
jgi:orotate phosphoribosyltransferase